MHTAPLDHNARSWFAAGYRIRVCDVDAGHVLQDRHGNLFLVLARTTAADGTHTLHTVHGMIERVQTFARYDDLNACILSTEADHVDLDEVLAAAARRRRAAEPARRSRFTDDDFFVWEVELHNRNGDFAGVRMSKGHIEDPDERGRTLCGRWVPEHASTQDDWQNGNQCKHCRRLAGLD